MALRWCRKNMGINNRKRTLPTWSIIKSYDCVYEMGEYYADTNEVMIYWNNCHNVLDVVSTCIHEWAHQLQPILTKYSKWAGDYDTNPYEIEARMKEYDLTPICWTEIRKKINADANSNRQAAGSRDGSNEQNKKDEGRPAKVRRRGRAAGYTTRPIHTEASKRRQSNGAEHKATHTILTSAESKNKKSKRTKSKAA